MPPRRAAAPVIALLLAAPGAPQSAGSTSNGVRLVLVLAVDQLRPDRLDASLPGGLGLLAREGRSFSEAMLAHGITETCPGHAAMLTGRHPAAAGIPSNEFFDPATGEVVYCAGDAREDALELGGLGGLSPRALRATALGDWMKEARPESRVFAVAGKDRGAIMLGGARADGAFWYRSGSPPRFTTSRYYRGALPAWVEAWNGEDAPADGFLAHLPERWEHGPIEPALGEDDFPGEATRLSRTSPHPLRDGDLATFGEQLYLSPYLDVVTLDFARRLVEEERLGSGPAPDLLAISLSATDGVGHLYGPDSHEARDALRRLDEALGAFLSFLSERVGGGALLVALTSDHGVLPLPEWLARRGEAICPDPRARAGVRRVGLGLLAHLWWRLAPLRPAQWVRFAGAQILLRRDVAAAREVPLERVAQETRSYLESWPEIAHVWTETEIGNGRGEIAELYRRSFVPGRSGDMVVQVARGCLVSPYDTGTSHGSPYEYDRRVPLVFFGAGVGPGVVTAPVATVDLAPTLAALLGVATPAGLDGRPLPWVVERQP
jgi:predicted AlkP superfamily pyrophosphatase or phosphodiesterase